MGKPHGFPTLAKTSEGELPPVEGEFVVMSNFELPEVNERFRQFGTERYCEVMTLEVGVLVESVVNVGTLNSFFGLFDQEYPRLNFLGNMIFGNFVLLEVNLHLDSLPD